MGMMATIHERRKNDRWMVPSVIGCIVMLMIQFGGIVWWGSNVSSKANSAIEFVSNNRDIPSMVRQVDAFHRTIQDIPIRVMKLESETDELQYLPSAMASLDAKFESLNTWIVEMRRDQRELKSTIDELNRLIMKHYAKLEK